MAKEDTQFKPGNPGKPKGAVSHLTRTVREVVLETFNKLQEDENKKYSLEAFAKENPKDFYQIAAKLIPTEVKGSIDLEVMLPTINIIRKDVTTDTETG